jgi:hypothetical protein
LVCCFHHKIWEVALGSTHPQLFAPTTTSKHYHKTWVQFTSPHSLKQWIHCFFTSPHSLQQVRIHSKFNEITWRTWTPFVVLKLS